MSDILFSVVLAVLALVSVVGSVSTLGSALLALASVVFFTVVRFSLES